MKRSILQMLLSVVVLFCLYTAYDLFAPLRIGSNITEIEVPKGATYRQAISILKGHALIRDVNVFYLLGRLTGTDRKIRAGYYSIGRQMNPFNIFNLLRKGQIIEYEIRVVEGDSLYEVAGKFAQTGIVAAEDFLSIARDPGFITTHGIQSRSIEGYLFPDTYLIPKGTRIQEAIGSMIDRMRLKYTSDLQRRAAELGMSENEVLTLASIIEKEAVIDTERTLISAVYHNRLKKRMPLQADPTAVYGVKSAKEKITAADLKIKTPYNTYVISGLPPGPIASPGLKSITAALYPADVPYLYFVSNNDGSHQFSATAAEHLRAVEVYRQRKKEQQREKADENSTS